MAFKKRYDVFIAYHGSYENNGSVEYAEKIYNYLAIKGLRCFFFPQAQNDAYKANIIEVMRSRVFLLVCTNGIHTKEEGRIDSQYHYELSTEIDAFYAMAQIGEASSQNAKIVACGNYAKGAESKLHELFANRTHFYYESDDVLEQLYSWLIQRIDRSKSWHESQITSEIKEVFATRGAMNQSCRLDDLIAGAKQVRAVGISNSELTARIHPGAIKNCVEHGGKIEILFLAPDGKFTAEREIEENHRRNRIRNITNVNIETAFEIRDRISVHKENMKLYQYDMQPRMNMIFVDHCLILQYYANNVPGIDNPSFLIERQINSPIFAFCERVYEHIKANAQLIEE